MEWETAIEEAKEQLGFSDGEWIADFDEVVELAKEIIAENNAAEYADYLASNEWKTLREQVLRRDYYVCKDCKKRAENVHHLTYDFLGSVYEADHCISLCRKCHEKRHHLR